MEFRELTELSKRTKITGFNEQYGILKNTIKNMFEKNKDCTPLFIAIVGSTSYSLDLETSDLDGKGVFIQDLDSILSELNIGDAKPNSYKNQIGNGEKIGNKMKEDVVFYELGRFLDLLSNNNPNILELLSTPDDCIIYKHPIWDILVKELKENGILTKKCYYTFYNYSLQQIKKATGLNKKINNPIDQKRKTPIDFCHIIFENDSTMELRSYLSKEKLDQRMIGLSKIPHARDLYSVYYDYESAKSFSRFEDETERKSYKDRKKEKQSKLGFGYKGIIKENENNAEVSDDLRLSSIPESEKRIAVMNYNKDGFMTYCKTYREYWGESGWMKMKNDERFKDNISSNQNYDGKNLSTCLRLLYMAKEISQNKGIIVKRTDEQRLELLEVKKGKWTYENIMAKCTELTNGLEEDFKNCTLPDEVSREFMVNTLKKYRKLLYNLN